MRRSILPLLAFLLAPALAPAQTDPAPAPNTWRFVHPNAKAVIGIDWKRVRESAAGAMLRDKFLNGNPFATAIPGFEFLNDVDRAVISSPGRAPDADENAEPPVLISLRGHFDLAQVRKVLAAHKTKPQAFNGLQVYRPQGKGSRDLAVVLLDPQSILIGDAHSVFTSLERTPFSTTPADTSAVITRASQLDATYDVWAIMNTPGSLAGDRLMDMFTGGELSTSAKGVEFGVSLRSGLVIDVATLFENDAAAKKLTSDLSKVLKLAIKDKMGEPAMKDIEKHLKLSSDGTTARISLRMTPQEVDKDARLFEAWRKQPGGIVAGVRPLITPSEPDAPAQPPPPPEKKTIRIEGLDGGTREIPYKPDGQQLR